MKSTFENYLESIGEYGSVEEINYPIATLTGLPNVSLNELVLFENNIWGLVTSFSNNRTQVLLLSTQPVKIKQRAARTDKSISTPINESLKGKVINPLGDTTDDLKEKSSENKEETLEGEKDERKIIETNIPNTSQRSDVTRQIVTGLPIIDMLLPLSHGQRAVVVGDQQTGKMSFLLSASEFIAKNDALVIYAAIGKHWSDLSSIRKKMEPALKEGKAIIVSSHSHDTPGLIHLTPYTAMSIAEHFRNKGQDVFVVFDDLSTHAKAYREISLLSKRFPGRESYPGDMFYIHAHLLERAGSFTHPEKGEVCITTLAVSETIETSFTPVIVSNLISITDGHLLFDSSIANQGRFPAIDFTLSISRVGHKTQPKALKKLSNKIAIFLSNYLKTEKYAHLGAELTEDVRDLITVGSQLIAFLSQEAEDHFPLPVQAVFAAMVWQKWLKSKSNEEIIELRNNFSKKYKSDKDTQDLLLPIIHSTNLDNMIKEMETNKEKLLNLCQTVQ